MLWKSNLMHGMNFGTCLLKAFNRYPDILSDPVACRRSRESISFAKPFSQIFSVFGISWVHFVRFGVSGFAVEYTLAKYVTNGSATLSTWVSLRPLIWFACPRDFLMTLKRGLVLPSFNFRAMWLLK